MYFVDYVLLARRMPKQSAPAGSRALVPRGRHAAGAARSAVVDPTLMGAEQPVHPRGRSWLPWSPSSPRIMTHTRTPPPCVPCGQRGSCSRWTVRRSRSLTRCRRRRSASSPIPDASAPCCSRNDRGSSSARSRPADRATLELGSPERRRRPGCGRSTWPRRTRSRIAARRARRRVRRRLTTATAGVGARRPARLARARAQPARPDPRSSCPIGDGLELDLVAHELRRGRPGRPPAAEGVRAARAARRASGPRLQPRASCSTASGARSTRAGRGRSMSTSAGSARRSSPSPIGPAYLVTVRGIGYRLDDRQR